MAVRRCKRWIKSRHQNAGLCGRPPAPKPARRSTQRYVGSKRAGNEPRLVPNPARSCAAARTDRSGRGRWRHADGAASEMVGGSWRVSSLFSPLHSSLLIFPLLSYFLLFPLPFPYPQLHPHNPIAPLSSVPPAALTAGLHSMTESVLEWQYHDATPAVTFPAPSVTSQAQS